MRPRYVLEDVFFILFFCIIINTGRSATPLLKCKIMNNNKNMVVQLTTDELKKPDFQHFKRGVRYGRVL